MRERDLAYPNENSQGIYLVECSFEEYMGFPHKYDVNYNRSQFSNHMINMLLTLYASGGILPGSDVYTKFYHPTIKSLLDWGLVEKIHFLEHNPDSEHSVFFRLSIKGAILIKTNHKKMEEDAKKDGFWLGSFRRHGESFIGQEHASTQK